MAPSGSLWLPLAPFGSLWLLLTLSGFHCTGSHWLSLPLSGILWPSLAHCTLISRIQSLFGSQGPCSALSAAAKLTHFIPVWKYIYTTHARDCRPCAHFFHCAISALNLIAVQAVWDNSFSFITYVFHRVKCLTKVDKQFSSDPGPIIVYPCHSLTH